MRSNWTENLHNVVRNSLDAFLSQQRAPSGEDNNLTNSHSHTSHVSHPRRNRAPIPEQVPRQYLTRHMNIYIRTIDPAQNDPIQIEDDDEDEKLKIESGVRPGTSKPLARTQSTVNHDISSVTQATTRQMPRHYIEREGGTAERRSIDNSQSANEKWLLGEASKPEPGSVTIQDPMKQSLNFKSAYRPVDTLTGSRASARSGHIGSTTHSSRLPQSHGFRKGETTNEDAHDHRYKRRKLDQSQKGGQSIQDAIDIGDSQQAEDSVDELGMSPIFQNGKKKQPALRSLEEKQEGAPTQNLGRVEISPSAEHKGGFTEASTQRRRAERDVMLKSSSPGMSTHQATQGKFPSPYFGKSEISAGSSRGVRRSRQLKSLGQESPDALQDDSRHPHTRLNQQHPPSLANVPATAFTRLLFEGDKSTAEKILAKKSTKTQASSLKTFKLLEFVSSPFAGPDFTLEVDERRKQILINTDLRALDTHPLRGFPMEKIIDIMHKTQSDLVCLEFSRSGNAPLQAYLRFESEKLAAEFVVLLQNAAGPLRVKQKQDDWMQSALSNARADISLKHQTPVIEDMPPLSRSAGQTNISRKYPQVTKEDTAERRTRHVDRLDLPAVVPEPTFITGSERRGTDYSRPTRHSRDTQPNLMDPDRAAISQNHSNPLRRVTRSQDSVKKDQCDRIIDSLQESVKASTLGLLGDPWQNDLRYEISEKRFGSVPYEDLGRLGHDEFLNDNLISFFVHYLENKISSTKPELSPRIHIFNTYFFETLTKTPKGQKGRGINYEGVSKWTKAVDLFKRDFVVVPVNENFHWYLAIICNLPYFLPDSEQGARQGIQPSVLEDTSAPSDGDADGQAIESEEHTQRSLAELSISDNDTSRQTPSKAKTKRGPGKRRVSRLPKYETDKPVIITLDSLGTPRSATSSILKQYVAAEAKNKKGLDIEPSELRGMTAKKIPTQSNFSDCGLYLCMYLEQFVANPDTFVYNILQREENTHQWPETIRGHDLRERLRDLLLELHRRQEHEAPKMKIPEVGSIMIEKPNAPPPRARHSLSPSDKEVRDQRSDGEGLTSHSNSTPASLDTNSRKYDQSERTANEPGLLDRIKPKTVQHRSQNDSRSGQNPREIVQVAASPPFSPKDLRFEHEALSHNDPSELATHLHNSRKRPRPYCDDGETQRQKSPKSTSTDFLSGLESYVDSQEVLSAGVNPSFGKVSAPRIPDDEALYARRKRTRHSQESAIHPLSPVIDSYTIRETPEIPKHNEDASLQVPVPTKKRQIGMDEVEIYEDTDEERIEGSGKA